MLKLVSFDVWDTLLSIKPFYKSVSEELSKIIDKPQSILEIELFKSYQRIKAVRRSGKFDCPGMVEMMREEISKLLKVDAKALEKATASTVKKKQHEQLVIRNTVGVLKFVKALGLKIITIGNVVFWPGSSNRTLLEKTGLSKLIDGQFYADEIGVSKPKPEIFAYALSKFDVKPEEALHVGDSLFEDFVGAIFSHMNAALIDKSLDKSVKLSNWNAYVLPDIKGLEQIIEELTSQS